MRRISWRRYDRASELCANHSFCDSESHGVRLRTLFGITCIIVKYLIQLAAQTTSLRTIPMLASLNLLFPQGIPWIIYYSRDLTACNTHTPGRVPSSSPRSIKAGTASEQPYELAPAA